MENDNNTQSKVEVTQNGAEVDTQTTTTNVETKKEEPKTYSQEDLDKNAADTRRATERDTKKKILAELGLKEGEEDKLSAYKQAYQDSLSEEEKRNQVMEELQADNLQLAQDVEEKDYIIKALVELTGKNEDDVSDIVKMAKGLKDDNNTIEDAIKKVISMINITPTNPATTVVTDNPDIPTGNELTQPSTVIQVSTQDNPWKPGSINLTKQAELLKTNPDLARRLKVEAGYKI